MKEKLTPQEAALYLGQGCMYVQSGIVTFLMPAALNAMYKEQRDVKLILRPLSDITEEEARELGFESARWACFTIGNGSNAKLSPSNFQYLLSKGFDLFSLIEQGKAINLIDNSHNT